MLVSLLAPDIRARRRRDQGRRCRGGIIVAAPPSSNLRRLWGRCGHGPATRSIVCDASTQRGDRLDHNPAMRRSLTRVSCAIFSVGDARTRPDAHLDFGKVWAQGRLNLNQSESVDAPPTAAAV